MKITVSKSGGNVFADIGAKHPEEARAKAQLAHAIALMIEARGLTQGEAARLLGIDQPKISNLVCGKLSGFSLDRLFRFLTLLGRDVEIIVKDHEGNGETPGHIRVAVG